MRTLVIINGVTGALGAACLAQFSREQGVTILGLSRQAPKAETFCVDGYLPDCTLICSIGDITDQLHCKLFVDHINPSIYQEILYIHAVGVYPFEVDDSGNLQMLNDDDGDGIDDRVLNLSYKAFFAMTEPLQGLGVPIKTLLFGGIADKFRPPVHTSWCKVIERVKGAMKERIMKVQNTSYFVLNISSVICPHELLTRPFVFQHTNASPQSWLMPNEVAERVVELMLSGITGLVEDELFHKANYYEVDYFSDSKFTPRKMAELGL